MKAIDYLVNLVAEGDDPRLVVERALNSVVGRPGEVGVKRRSNASTDQYFGGEVVAAETGVVDGKQVIIWTIADKWSGRKIFGV